MLSADIPDWSREKPRSFWDPTRKLLKTLRQYQRWYKRRGLFAFCLRKMIVLRYRFWSLLTGAEIPLNANIGGGLMMIHPNGIVIHCSAKIGVNCLIFQQVTVGADYDGTPTIEGGVEIGAGAKIIGPVHIGAYARIGANAVVVHDIPPRSTAVGIPAKVVKRF